MNEIIINNNGGTLTVPSMQVAENFGKRHDHVIRDIETIKGETSPQKWGNLFIESTYADSYGRQQKCYDLTRDGFSLLVMGFTGKKALEWKLKYIEAFNLMEAKLKEQAKQIPQMSVNELIFEMAKSNLETEKRINALEVKQQAIEERTEKVLDVFSMPTNITWHEAITSEFKKICYKNNLNYQVVLGDLYKELESEVGCDLTARQRNKQKRMKTAGCTVKQIKHDTSKIMLIEDDDALRLAFENIFRKFQVRYIQGNNVQEYI